MPRVKRSVSPIDRAIPKYKRLQQLVDRSNSVNQQREKKPSNDAIVKKIIYGNHAVKLSKKTAAGHTHQWTLFVHSLDPKECLSKYVRKVEFLLHETYKNPLRVIDSPPFELTETGYGDFDVQLKLIFVDINTKFAKTWFHLNFPGPMDGDYIRSEFYDEIVFSETTEEMRLALTTRPKKQDEPKEAKIIQQKAEHYEKVRQKLKDSLEAANKELLAEIADLEDSLNASLSLLKQAGKQLGLDYPNESKENEPVTTNVESTAIVAD